MKRISLALLLFVSAVGLCAQTLAVGTFNTTNLLESGTTYVLATNDNVVNLLKERGLGLLADLKPGGATNTFALNLQFSPDGVLWATNSQLTITLNVSTNMTWQTNLPAALTDNSRFLRLYSITTANTNKMTNAVYWSRHL